MSMPASTGNHGPRYSTSSRSTRLNVQPRKKACQQCSDAKARCDLQRPSCSRCNLRYYACVYQVPASGFTHDAAHSVVPCLGTGVLGVADGNQAVGPDAAQPSAAASPESTVVNPVVGLSAILNPTLPTETPETNPRRTTFPISEVRNGLPLGEYDPEHASVSFASVDLDLVPAADSTRIGTRWLDFFVPSPTRVVKALSDRTVLFMSRVLKTYPRNMLREGALPPIIHPLQLATERQPVPLVNCLSLVRMWEGRARGSEAIVTQTITREMERVFQEHQSYDQMDLLAASQAYLMYAIMGFFTGEGVALTDGQTVINLQELASRMSATGLVCTAEFSHSRPTWESWVVAETKRRTLYTMYMFDNVFNFVKGTPSYLAAELGVLPAPASKALWHASRREVWEREYDLHLGEWEGGGFRLGELWPPQPETDLVKRAERLERWSGSLDEFGMMLFAVCTLTHGG